MQIGLPGEIAFAERIQWEVSKGQRCQAGSVLLLSDPLWIKQQGGTPSCTVSVLNGSKLRAIVITSDSKVRIKDNGFISLYN